MTCRTDRTRAAEGATSAVPSPAARLRRRAARFAREPIRRYAAARVMGWPRFPLPIRVAAAPLLCGCQLFGKGVPAAERPPAAEAAAPAPTPAGPAEATRGGAAPEPDEPTAADGAPDGDEPDLLADADDADDEHADGTPGEGPPAVPSLDRRGVPVASRYAGLDRSSCEAELRRRRIAFTRVGEARGVVAPLRLAGPLSGVTFRSNLPASKSRTSPYDIYDCRLVLALDDFARVLTKHDIVEVVHLSVYRPVSKKVALKGAGRRHGGALAIDAALFKTKDGRTLSVEKDFRPRRIGARPCPAPATASELRKIACEASDAQLFNVLLTPHYNRAHRNHFHLEVTAGVRWTLVR